MSMQSLASASNLELALFETVKSLTPARLAQVLDFARWLQTQPAFPKPDAVDQAADEKITTQRAALAEIRRGRFAHARRVGESLPSDGYAATKETEKAFEARRWQS